MPSLQINEVTTLYLCLELCDTGQAFNTMILSVLCVIVSIMITAIIYSFKERYLIGGIRGRGPRDEW